MNDQEQVTEGFMRKLREDEQQVEKQYQDVRAEYRQRRADRVAAAMRSGGPGLRIAHIKEYSSPLLVEVMSAYYGEPEPTDPHQAIRLPRDQTVKLLLDLVSQIIPMLMGVLAQRVQQSEDQAPRRRPQDAEPVPPEADQVAPAAE